MQKKRIWTNARLATMAAGLPGLGIVEDGLIAAEGDRITFAGLASDFPYTEGPSTQGYEVTDCGGRWILPGLIDCHTHLVWAGSRADEFERRLAGASYEEIARSGGGIRSTVSAVRAASEAELVAESLPRLNALIGEGVTTIEIKSGYGLNIEDELKQLRAARALGEVRPIDVETTLLAAHTLPPEYEGRADAYIDLVCNEIIPAAAQAGLASAVDAFCETIGFTPEQTGRVLSAARHHGLAVKLHADQLSNLQGGALAARHNALSADHLEYLDEAGIAAMAQAGMVAVMLPGAYYVLRETHPPPLEGLRRAGVSLAISTDCNPGTSPLTSILLAMNMGATLFRMTVEECLLGTTRHAARALGLEKATGTLEAGKLCNLSIWDIDRPAELVNAMGLNPLHTRVWRGQ
ncbi:imidazolonepropionase [Hyphomonas neptunium ATCC 15444]|uniref:Imidazolonepropionase n=2 Tax=Hyphomonas TaxID=85 RepID=HUTI_HYPNA|nr:imidazolonepropionase [Hyphomonas hirschiana]Q0BZK3.1 RecName: Full=Imidazolonepropionase; AltName: Full=Imidazolone-5-propionate hydrolase [Hyphomonas neptunium ATCC 15444]ABI76937.1 imidazolonepropionase [Hyphomonas neptunium ATCC 15444]KCZ95180.1 imidazolonepropionase [Hyphomonas hirschiana VP5]